MNEKLTMLISVVLVSLCIDVIRAEPVFMCDSQIYCQGPIIEAVNRLGIFNDSKDYVDMPLKQSQADTLAAFKKRFPDESKIEADDLRDFLDEYFLPPGLELTQCTPIDWKSYPGSFTMITDENFRNWAFDLHAIWKTLCRRIDDIVGKEFDKNSLIYVPNNFIAPGGRFREYYYWDTYWIIKGLLVSQMYETVRGIIQNFAFLVTQLGFIPNGGRVYYLQRSQPPFLIPMLYEYFSSTNDLAFLKEMLPYMAKELDWWNANRRITVSHGERNYTVYRHVSPSNTPRPESFKEDVALAEQVNNGSRAYLLQNVASVAETGQDFSSRFFADPSQLTTARITDILPVDLNAYMCWNMDIMHLLYTVLGEYDTAKYYYKLRAEMQETIEDIFYNNVLGSWFDLDAVSKQHLTNFYPSNVAPLFTGCYDTLDTAKPKRLYQYMTRVGALKFPDGVPSSLVQSGQQWDFPNGWAPQNHMIIEGFRKSGVPDLQEAAFQLTQKWVSLNYLVYKKNGAMYEKYNITDTTFLTAGSGGEYQVQTGFGWTNGAALDLMKTYANRLVSPDTRYQSTQPSSADRFTFSLDVIFASFIVLGVCKHVL